MQGCLFNSKFIGAEGSLILEPASTDNFSAAPRDSVGFFIDVAPLTVGIWKRIHSEAVGGSPVESKRRENRSVQSLIWVYAKRASPKDATALKPLVKARSQKTVGVQTRVQKRAHGQGSPEGTCVPRRPTPVGLARWSEGKAFVTVRRVFKGGSYKVMVKGDR